MIPRETVDLILDSAQIVDVVSDYVTLKRRGANYTACCPFHNEKTPSFYVSPSKGIYKCFGCAKSGTAVGFVMEQEHCSYIEALRYLARKYHIEIHEEEESVEEIERRQRSESLLLASEFAQKFFASQLSSPGPGRDVGYAYYRRRGIEDSTISRFGLGWAPGGRTALVDAATASGYKLEYLVAAGLAVQNEDGSVTDKFRERVMFPIHSVSGRVIAFSGRTLKADNPAKYVNSPETEIYIKSRNLLGIYFAKAEISRMDKCILVEGNVDMVMMHQLGISNVVASCGTSLTIEQIRLIHKFTGNITIMYDGDSAGIHAALRGINMILAEGMDVKIVLLPPGEDPDSFSRSHTLDEVRAYIADREQDFISFKCDILLEQAGSDPLKKAALINDIADTIAVVPDAVKRSMYVEVTAARFNIDQGILFQRISATRKSTKEEAAPVEKEVSEVRYLENKTLAVAESELLGFMLTNGCDPMDFATDSEYYSGDENDKPTVTDFIRGAMEADGIVFANSIYARLYDAYTAMYDDGLMQNEIIIKLLNSPQRDMADVCSQLTTQKYQLTVKDFADSMTTTSSWLVTQVPKSILVYGSKRVQARIDEIKHLLADSENPEMMALMQELIKLQKVNRKINRKLGREKIS